MSTIERVCICCGDGAGHRIPLGRWSIAGAGEMQLAIRICANCGAAFQDPAPRPEVMQTYYKNYSNYTNVSRDELPDECTVDTVAKQVSIIKNNLAPGRAYEIGCATGYMLSELKKVGWDVTGCDPSPTAADVAIKKWGIKIHTGYFENIPLTVSSLDLIILSHVLEHIYDPVASLRRAHEFLSPSGHLLVEVPCLTHPEKWPNGYFTFEHVNIFSKNILMNCLRQAGFETIYSEIVIDHPHYPVIVVLAKKSTPLSWPESQTDSTTEVVSLINKYISTESSEWDRIDRLLKKELAGFEQIAVWGGGVHTSQLLDKSKVLSTKNIFTIIDIDPQKTGLNLLGIKINHPDLVELDRANIAVVISSRASENEIYSMLLCRSNTNAKVIRLYGNNDG